MERTGHEPPSFIRDRYGPPFTTTLGLAVTVNEQMKRRPPYIGMPRES